MKYTGMGRSELLTRIEELEELEKFVKDSGMGRDDPGKCPTGRKIIEEHKAMFKNLSATQDRCTKLLEENRELKHENDELKHEILQVSNLLELSPRQKEGFYKVLLKLASSTSARWDQHLRYEIPDEDANMVIKLIETLFFP